MSLLDEPVCAPARQARACLGGRVRLAVLSQMPVDPSPEGVGRRLAEEVTPLNSGLSVESRHLLLDTDRAGDLATERVPAIIAVLGESVLLERVEQAARRTGGGLVVP